MYAIGLALSQNLGPFKLSDKELELVKLGLTDGVLGKEKKVDLQTYGPKLNALAQSRLAASASAEKKASESYLAKATGEKGDTKAAAGMIFKEVATGTGACPTATA